MKHGLLLCAVSASLLLSGCASKSPEPASATIFALDTVMEVTVYGDSQLLTQAENLVLDMEKRLSVTENNSEIATLNLTHSGLVSEDTAKLLSKALEICQKTDGALDISVYPVVQAWGFTTEERRVPTPQELAEALAKVDYHKISLNANGAVSLAPDMQIDLGSVAKGWAGDALIELFRQNHVKSALLNLGGNVQVLGAKPDGSPWRVGIKDPCSEGYAGVLEVTDKAVITSGGYQRYFEQNGKTYHHIIDPATGYPADNGLLSVTVIGGEGVVCDGLSTSLFVMGMGKAVEFWKTTGDFEAVFITDSRIVITGGLEDCFEPLGRYQTIETAVIHYD